MYFVNLYLGSLRIWSGIPFQTLTPIGEKKRSGLWSFFMYDSHNYDVTLFTILYDVNIKVIWRARNAEKHASEKSSERTENKSFEVKKLGGTFTLHEFLAPPPNFMNPPVQNLEIRPCFWLKYSLDICLYTQRISFRETHRFTIYLPEWSSLPMSTKQWIHLTRFDFRIPRQSSFPHRQQIETNAWVGL